VNRRLTGEVAVWELRFTALSRRLELLALIPSEVRSRDFTESGQVCLGGRDFDSGEERVKGRDFRRRRLHEPGVPQTLGPRATSEGRASPTPWDRITEITPFFSSNFGTSTA
jgi:hypothetical protein